MHRLSLRDYKGVTQRDLLFPDAGILVVEGPNEVGKTTMLDALDLLLDHKDSSRRAQIRAAQPVGRDVGPSVEVELSTGPYRFTYRKQWLRQTATELTVHTPTRAHLVGDEAHERVKAILAQTTDLQLWKALRLLQAQPLVHDGLGASTALAAALDRAGGTAVDAGPAGETLLSAAQAAYLRYYTARTAQPTGEWRAAIERLEAAELGERAAREAVREVADDVERHESTQGGLQEARHRFAEVGQRRRAIDDELVQARELAAQLAAARARRDELSVALERERERLAERVAAREQAQRVDAALGAAEAAVADAHAALEPAHDDLLAADAAHAAAQEGVLAARAHLTAVSARRDRARAAAERAALRSKIAAIDEAHHELAQVRELLGQSPVSTVSTTVLRDLEQAAQSVDLEQAAHAVGSARIVIRAADAPVELSVQAGAPPISGETSDVPATVTLGRGQSWESAIGQRLALHLPGVEIELEPESGAAQRVAALAEARAHLKRRLAEVGCASLEVARVAHDERHDLHAQEAGLQARVRALLDGSDRAELLERLAALGGALELPPGPARAADPETGIDPDEWQRAQQTEEQARAEADRARLRRDSLAASVEAMRLELTRAASAAAALRDQLADLDGRLAAARDRRADDDLESQVAAAHARLVQADDAVGEVQARSAGHEVAALEPLRDACAAEVGAVGQRVAALEGELIRLQARLDQAGGQGRAESLDAALTELEQARRVHERIRRHAEAARLLHETLAARNGAAKQAYVRPFAQTVARLGRIVYGPTFEVEVADELTIVARIIDGERIPFEALSTGAKEQLAILTRLACAVLVDADQGVPVVIDDALGYSDPDKLRRVCAAVGQLHDQAQVVLLTCTPGRYAAIPQAHVVRL
nr:AAA family ATPase [Kineosphaera limosa]